MTSKCPHNVHSIIGHVKKIVVSMNKCCVQKSLKRKFQDSFSMEIEGKLKAKSETIITIYDKTI